MPIDLSSPRTIAIEDRGRPYTFTISPITREQWLKYFAGIVSTSEMQGRTRVDSFDASAARLELVESALQSCTGYAGDPIATPGWPALLPMSHRLAIANALISVERAAAVDEGMIELGAETVFLDAVWGTDEAGVMRKHHNLAHTFKTPSADHQRRYSREMSRSRVVGGSRTGKTQWLGAQATLVELYDELILRVAGYQAHNVADDALSTFDLVALMDTYHKVAAAEQLFAPAEVKLEEAE